MLSVHTSNYTVAATGQQVRVCLRGPVEDSIENILEHYSGEIESFASSAGTIESLHITPAKVYYHYLDHLPAKVDWFKTVVNEVQLLIPKSSTLLLLHARLPRTFDKLDYSALRCTYTNTVFKDEFLCRLHMRDTLREQIEARKVVSYSWVLNYMSYYDKNPDVADTEISYISELLEMGVIRTYGNHWLVSNRAGLSNSEIIKIIMESMYDDGAEHIKEFNVIRNGLYATVEVLLSSLDVTLAVEWGYGDRVIVYRPTGYPIWFKKVPQYASIPGVGLVLYKSEQVAEELREFQLECCYKYRTLKEPSVVVDPYTGDLLFSLLTDCNELVEKRVPVTNYTILKNPVDSGEISLQK